MLKAPMGKGDNMQPWTSNFSRQMKTTKETQIENVRNKKTQL